MKKKEIWAPLTNSLVFAEANKQNHVAQAFTPDELGFGFSNLFSPDNILDYYTKNPGIFNHEGFSLQYSEFNGF